MTNEQKAQRLNEIANEMEQSIEALVDQLDHFKSLVNEAARVGEDTCFDKSTFDTHTFPQIRCRLDENHDYLGGEENLSDVWREVSEAADEMANMEDE